jgi:hypothetical protein
MNVELVQPAPPDDPVRRVRRAYAENVYLGLCLWFDEFGRHAFEGAVGVCEALLRDARDMVRQLAGPLPRLGAYVASREGVLHLCRGLAHHRQGDYARAEACYRQSLAIQNGLGGAQACAGQVQVVLELLADEIRTGARGPEFEAAVGELHALGSSEQLLADRVAAADPAEARLVIQAAREARLVGPLARAARSPDPGTRQLALAALSRFRAVGRADVLVQALRDPTAFVRWQAAEALGLAEEALPAELVGVFEDALASETDPEVRRALALALGKAGSAEATPALVGLLEDADAPVRYAAATALGAVGDRRALDVLGSVREDGNWPDESVANAAAGAARAIEARHSPRLEELRAARQLPGEGWPRFAGVYWPHETVIGAVRLEGADDRTRLVWSCDRGAVEEAACGDLAADLAVPAQGPFASPGDRPSGPPREAEATMRVLSPSLLLPFPPPQGVGWQPGEHTIRVAVRQRDNDTLHWKSARFRVVSEVLVKRATLCLEIDAWNRPARPVREVPVDARAVYCSVLLSEAPWCQALTVELWGPDGQRVSQTSGRTWEQGEHHEAVRWQADRWAPGTYQVRIFLDGRPAHEKTFQAAPPRAAPGAGGLSGAGG